MKSLSLLLASLILSIVTLSLYTPVEAVLSTKSRWIIDESGKRVKLACVNWPSHLQPMVAEGLHKQPVDVISKSIVSRGFNCVRLTYATFMLTNESLASLTVKSSFESLNLTDALQGIGVHNPSLLDLTLIQAYQAVVSNLGENEVMVILDNHLTVPGWCCGYSDGNGFFGDKYFDPDVWIQGLQKMATSFHSVSNVVGMSLRNELRGPRQNVTNWYRYMQKGAEAIHTANPNVLVILSGLSFDNDLSFLSSRQVQLSFTRKLVFEVHWYSFSDSKPWSTLNTNQACAKTSGGFMGHAGFLLAKEWPLFMSEFGVDNRGVNDNDNRYLGCILAKLAELDLDWALWALQGSYYLREGKVDHGETFGVLSADWTSSQNTTVLQRIQALQKPFQGPGYANSPLHQKIFHPATALCMTQKSTHLLQLGPCDQSTAWRYTEEGNIKLRIGFSCIKVERASEPVQLGIDCSREKWEPVSASKMHLASMNTSEGNRLCLDVDRDGKTIVANPCNCLSDNHNCDPTSQWFKLVNSTNNFH
ncbi:Cellulase (glycosyl hydrolase family 5) protein [Rhynchospora pubera]|uniref:Cellulase (Glycosyl hydrolase family 5) protein n=1 Tax=Rhynchospora pubera TaxID=906938 RepID=A0AAV8CPQ4_9POAL|nr:Cellulase (glycosyl hydrolase family 5) protein [Rhynchospora pubera]